MIHVQNCRFNEHYGTRESLVRDVLIVLEANSEELADFARREYLPGDCELDESPRAWAS